MPTGSVLSDEYWDDQLPRDLGPGLNSIDRQYSSVRFDLYADRVSYRDLMDVADSLTTLPLLEGAGVSLRKGNVAAAAESIRQAGQFAISLPADQRDALSGGLDRISAELRGPAGALGRSFGNAARAIREDPEEIAAGFGSIANELMAADDNEAANYIYRNLEQIDYYVISSNRVMAAMPQSPWRYPVQTKFYEALKAASSVSLSSLTSTGFLESVRSSLTTMAPTNLGSITTIPMSGCSRRQNSLTAQRSMR